MSAGMTDCLTTPAVHTTEDRPRFSPEGKQTEARSAEGFPVGFDPRPGHDVNRLFRSILLNHFAFFVDCFITVFLHAFRCPETQ